MAEVFATTLDNDSGSKIVAVASRSETKAVAFAVRHGRPKAFGSYETMLSDPSLDLDIVYIATPAKYHAEHIRLCLEAGQNVLCEKPITTTSCDLEPLIKLARTKGLFLMEGMWMKTLPTFQQAKQMILDGKIGKTEMIRVDFYKREIVDYSRSIFNKSEGGGVLMDYGIYALAFAIDFLGGEPESIRYEVRKNNEGIDTDWSIVMNHGNIRVVVNISSDFNSVSKATVIGSNGSIEWEAQFNRTNHIKRFNAQNKLQEEVLFRYKYEGYEYEVEHVSDCLKKNLFESDIVPLECSMKVMKVVDMLKN